jgi:oligoribonuclease NrnB/cAMP/cGMP phosphodiesterase (DHH superfamily)
MILSGDIIIDENVEKIKKRAESLRNAELSSFEETVKYVRMWLADYYKIPSKSPIFDEYTAEELFFEYHFLNAPEKKTDAASMVRESANELASLFNEAFSEEENTAMDKMFGNDVNWTLDDIKDKG